MRHLLIPTFLFVLASASLQAQNKDYRFNFSGQWALNGWQLIALSDNFIEADTVVGAYVKATGTYGLTCDIALAKWFSIGTQATWNTGKIGADDLSVVVDGKEYSGTAQVRLRRINFGARPLFHYFNGGRFDWYSGFRVGINYVKTSVDIGTDIDIANSEILDRLIGNNWFLNRSYRGVRPTIQFIPIGVRGYITKNIGFGIETALGPTYYLSGSVNYRF